MMCELLRIAATAARLPYTPGRRGCGCRVLVGLWYVVRTTDPAIAQRISQWLCAHGQIPQQEPVRIAQDPLGALFGTSNLLDYDAWRRSPKPLEAGLYNPFFASLIEEHLSIVMDTCRENDVATALNFEQFFGEGNEHLYGELDDPTLIHRLWQQIVPVTATFIGIGPITYNRENAIKELKRTQPTISKRINQNWQNPEIDRRGGGSPSLRRRYELLGVRDPHEIIVRSARWQFGLSEGLPSKSLDQKQLKSTFGNEDIRLVAGEGDLAAGHIRSIAQKAMAQNSLGATATMLMLAGFVRPERIRDIIVSKQGDSHSIESSLSRNAEYAIWDQSLCFPLGAPFMRAVPASVFLRFEQSSRGIAPEQIRDEMAIFLRGVVEYATPEMLVRFICHQAPICYGLPRTFGAFGFAELGEPLASGGWVAYARHHPASAAQLGSQYFEAIGIDPADIQLASLKLDSCGSGGVVNRDVAQAMFEMLTARLVSPTILGIGEENLLRSLARWNGTVALFALALQALCFRRPYRYQFPEIISTDGSVQESDLVYEKVGPRRIVISPLARRLAKTVHGRFLELQCQLPKAWIELWPIVSGCAAFLSFPDSGKMAWPSTHSTADMITRSLAYDAELSRFAAIFPGFARHTADYAMRLAGMSESEIDLLSDHAADRTRARLSNYSLEGPAWLELHARGENAVAEYLGLS